MATADTQSPLAQLQDSAAAAMGNAKDGLAGYANDASAQLAKLLRDYLSQFQDYIGQTGELAITAVFSVAEAAATGEGDLFSTREKAEQDMMTALSAILSTRLRHLADLLEQENIGDNDDEAAREVIRRSMQSELDRLVMVPFAVPLLHEIGRSYGRVSDTWRGNLVVQGLRNLADVVSHKVSAVAGAVSLGLMKQDMDATGEHAAALAEKAEKAQDDSTKTAPSTSSSSSTPRAGAKSPSKFKSPLLQPVEQYAPVTSTDVGTSAAATLDSTAAKALWVEEHLADVINALWRLLSHDLDRVLRGAADGALRDIQSSESEVGALGVQDAARILGIMANIFQAALRPFAPGAPAAVDAHTLAAVEHGNLALAAASALGGVESILPLDEYQVPESKLPQHLQEQQQQQQGKQAGSDASKVVDRAAKSAAEAADSAAAGVQSAAEEGGKAATSAAADAKQVATSAADQASDTAVTAAERGSAAAKAAVDEGADAAVDITKSVAAKVDRAAPEVGKQAEAAARDAGKVARVATDAAATATDQAAAAAAAAAPEISDQASRKAAAAGEGGKKLLDVHDQVLDAGVAVSKDVAAAANDAIEGGAAAAHDALDKGTPILLDTIDKSAPEINKAAAVTAEEAKKVTKAVGAAAEQSVDAAAAAVEETAAVAATETKSVVDQYSAAVTTGTRSLADSADRAIAAAPAAADSAAATGLKSVTPGVITAADQVRTGADQLRDMSESAPQLVQQLGDKVTNEVIDQQGHEGVDKVQQQARGVAEQAKQQVQQAGQVAAANIRSAAAGAAGALPVLAEDVAREAGNVKDTLVPQVITPTGAEVSKTITTATAQAAAATAAAATTAADTLPQLTQQFVEDSLKPAAAAAAEQLPGMVEQVGGQLLDQEADVISDGVITTTRLLGEGTAQNPGLLAIAADTARVAPEAVKEYDETVLMPAVKGMAADVVELAKGAESQADLVLGLLASSCRTQDPKLLNELRGELLYMARCIEEPVSSARDALAQADIPQQAQQLEEKLVPAVEQVTAAVEEGVAKAAPELEANLDELAGLVTKEGEELAEGLQENAAVAHDQLSSITADVAQKLPQAADDAGNVLTAHADSAAAVIQDKGDQLATGLEAAGQELGTATTAATEHAAAAISAAADATASAATTAADTARQQQQQGEGLAAAGAAAAEAVESVTAGVSKGLVQGVEEVGVVGHEGVEQAKQGAQQTTDVATSAADKLADSGTKAAAALDSAAGKLKDTAHDAAAAADNESGARDAAASAAGKTAGVLGSSGGKLAAAAEDAAAAIPEPAAAAGNVVKDTAAKIGNEAAAAAQRIADSAGINDGDVSKVLRQGVTDAPAAAATAVKDVIDSAAAAGSGQSKVAAGEAESALDVLVTGVKGAAGKMSEAVGISGTESVTGSKAGKKSDLDSGGKSEGKSGAPGLEDDDESAVLKDQQGNQSSRKSERQGVVKGKKDEKSKGGAPGGVSYASVVAGAPAGAEAH